MAYVNFSLNIVADLSFALVIPFLMLWDVKLPLRTKISLLFVLGLGCVATVGAVMRVGYLSTVSDPSTSDDTLPFRIVLRRS